MLEEKPSLENVLEKIAALERYRPIKHPDWTRQNPLTGLVIDLWGGWISRSQVINIIRDALAEKSS